MNYVLENQYLKVEVSDLGARIIRLINKKSDKDLIMGLDDEQYLNNRGLYIGASVGRNCNLIVGSSFSLNGKTYHLTSNLGGDQLHGGIDGFSFVTWNVGTEKEKVIFKRNFEDGLDGYPGNMQVTITYELIENRLSVTFSAISDQDGIFNPTLHTYFNMGSKNFEGVFFKTETHLCAEVNGDNQPLDTIFDTRNTAYDFSEFAPIKKQIASLKNGIDTNYVYETMENKLLCTLKTDTDQLKIYSDLPGLEMYTCNDFDKVIGKDNEIYDFRCGVALEPDFFPNSINFDKYLKPIIKANEEVSHTITYEID